MQDIAIIDYGMGNVHSVQKALAYVAPDDHIFLTADPQLIADADRVVFPGQGAMGACLKALEQHNLTNVICEAARQKPFLGICLGLHLLFEGSEEDGGTAGLSILKGRAAKFTDPTLKIPHIGWNTVAQKTDHPLWHKIKNHTRFYSVHSYFVVADDDITAGITDYGVKFASAVAKDKIFAVQFHPEKSQDDGLQLLQNFVSWRG